MLKIFIILMQIMSSTGFVYDFNKESNPEEWQIVDDVVMGGRSQGNFMINEEGYGVFYGKVSLENNGGFSSLRHQLEGTDITGSSKAYLYVKGDGKRYQFRVKSNRYERQSYIAYFETTGEWEIIEIPLKKMYPSWRGMKLDMPNYSAETLEEITFLIANYRAEEFRLEIDKVVFR